MVSNPGRIRQIVTVPLPHPRDRSAPVLRRTRDDILQQLSAGSGELAGGRGTHLRTVRG